jgi:tetratricopeptide (TPR) repeat protein
MTNGASIRDLERRLAAAPASPLFARLAFALLNHGEVARAEALCERGVGLYPHYSTGRLVYARCMAARRRYAEAVEALEPVIAAYPGNLVLADLQESWRGHAAVDEAVAVADDGAEFTEVPVEEHPVVAMSHDVAETPPRTDEAPTDAIDPPVEEIPLAEEAPATPAVSVVPDHAEVMHGDGGEPPAPVPSKHAGTVPILQPVPMSLNRTSFIEPDRIVSRTLAEIYASQGAIGEAVETYRILLERMPERSERLEERLRELEVRMKSDPGPRPERVE